MIMSALGQKDLGLKRIRSYPQVKLDTYETSGSFAVISSEDYRLMEYNTEVYNFEPSGLAMFFQIVVWEFTLLNLGCSTIPVYRRHAETATNPLSLPGVRRIVDYHPATSTVRSGFRVGAT